MSIAAPTFTVGDASGLAALIAIVATALFMLFRPLLLKITRKLSAIRSVHLAIAIAAGFLLILHISYFITYSLSAGILLGYSAFVASLLVWLTGTAFLERTRDSLFFHGILTILLVILILMHAAVTTVGMSFAWYVTLMGAAIIVAMVNALYHLQRGLRI